ncbi:MAG: hypothetical protein JWR18_3283 [Segetibacter sp.]|jgi:hypothetical protein|nr:hypothetical protein [Segetibacter sp.]
MPFNSERSLLVFNIKNEKFVGFGPGLSTTIIQSLRRTLVPSFLYLADTCFIGPFSNLLNRVNAAIFPI